MIIPFVFYSIPSASFALQMALFFFFFFFFFYSFFFFFFFFFCFFFFFFVFFFFFFFFFFKNSWMSSCKGSIPLTTTTITKKENNNNNNRNIHSGRVHATTAVHFFFPQEMPQTHRQLHFFHRWQPRTRQVMKISMNAGLALIIVFPINEAVVLD